MFLFLIMFLARNGADCLSDYYVIQMPVDDPPNNRVPLNNPPMQVYWNVPTMQCTSKKIMFQNLYEKYGIIQNQEDSFRGDRIAILYDPGIFPAIFKNDTSGRLRFRNGGVPQEGDIVKHLDSFISILNQSIPDEEFDGIGIIDFESWRPIYRQNFGELSPYKDVSYEIERSNHWWWPSAMVTNEAKRRFEDSARTFMGKTLVAARQMRPLARWGYYAYPYCFNSKTDRCADKVLAENDQISWLWSESTALYPSVYSPRDLTPSQLSQLVKGRVNEAARAKRAHGRGNVPILPYFWYKYRDGGYLKEDDLETFLKAFDNSDASGFIIWGSSNDVNTLEKCFKLYNYVENILGPAIAKYTKQQTTNNNVELNVVTTEMFNESINAMNVTDNRYMSFNNESVNLNGTDVKDSINSSVITMNNDGGKDNFTANHEFNSEVNFAHDNETTLDKTEFNDTFILFSDDLTKLSLEQFEVTKKDDKDVQSSFSLYSSPLAFINDNLKEKNSLTTTETSETNKITTEEFNFIPETDALDSDYNWVPPENYSQDIVNYVKQEFIEKSTVKNDHSDIKETELVQNSYNQTLIGLLLDTIFPYHTIYDSNLENKSKSLEDTIILKSKNVSIKNPKVHEKTTIPTHDYLEIRPDSKGLKTDSGLKETNKGSRISSMVKDVTEETITEPSSLKIHTSMEYNSVNNTDDFENKSLLSSKDTNSTESNNTVLIIGTNTTTEPNEEIDKTTKNAYTVEYTTLSSKNYVTEVIQREADEKDKVQIDEITENGMLTTTDTYLGPNISYFDDVNGAKSFSKEKQLHNSSHSSTKHNEITNSIKNFPKENDNSTKYKTHKMYDMKLRHHGNKKDDKDVQSSFSLYSSPLAFINDNLKEKNSMTTTGTSETNKTTTAEFDFIPETDALDSDYNWVPPENYSQEIVNYVKQEFIEKSTVKNDHINIKETELVEKENGRNQTLIGLLLDTIFSYHTIYDSNLENKSRSLEDAIILKSKNVSIKNPKVHEKTTIPTHDYLEIRPDSKGLKPDSGLKETNEGIRISNMVKNVTAETITEPSSLKIDTSTEYNKVNNTDDFDYESLLSSKDTNSTESNDTVLLLDTNTTTEPFEEIDNTTENVNIILGTNTTTEPIEAINNTTENVNMVGEKYTVEYTTLSSKNFVTEVIKREADQKDKVKIDEITENGMLTTTDKYLGTNISYFDDVNEAKSFSKEKQLRNSIHSSTKHNEITNNINAFPKENDNSTDSESHKMHDMKHKHHGKHTKKGCASCHHMSEKEEITAKTAKKPEKKPKHKEFISNKLFHDAPIYEELTSSDFTEDQVTGSATGPSAKHYMYFLFYLYSVSKCMCEVYR